MHQNMVNNLAEAMKALDGKKFLFLSFAAFCGAFSLMLLLSACFLPSRPCSHYSRGSCFGSHDEAGLYCSCRGPARGTHGRSYCVKKPPLRTSTGRHRFRMKPPLMEPRMWQGQIWETRPAGESTRGKAKFGKEACKPQVGRRELRNTKASPREGENRPLFNVPQTSLGIRRQGGLLSITLCFSNAGNASAAIFWWFFGIRSGPS